MKIFVSSIDFPDRITVSDKEGNADVDITQPLQLVFFDGDVTFEILKKLYLAGRDAYFVVKNMEHFMFKMRLFRNLQFVIYEQSNNAKRSLSGMLGVFGVSSWEMMTTNLRSMVEKYISVEQQLRSRSTRRCKESSFISGSPKRNDKADNIEVNSKIRGLEISFRPKLLESIKTSLENPKLYKSKETAAHRIFKLLKNGKMGLEEIENAVGKDAEVALKSLLHFKAVVKRSEFFVLADILI